MTVLCRGWQQKHQVDELVDVQVAYLGALSFPSRYSMCVDCVALMQEYVDGLRERHGSSAVQFFVAGEAR